MQSGDVPQWSIGLWSVTLSFPALTQQIINQGVKTEAANLTP